MKYSYLTSVILASVITLSGCGNSDAPTKSDEPVSTDIVTETEVSMETEVPQVVEAVPPTPVVGLINPNEATQFQLQTLTSVAGENVELVNALLAARPFENAKAMDTFFSNYMGEEARDIVYKRMFIPMDLNSTPEADFMIIPGVGKKMAHEFEEYRPYTDMARFDKEISKYVDAEELARLRQYVTLK